MCNLRTSALKKSFNPTTFIFLALFFLIAPRAAWPDLSVTNQWRIEQAMSQCEATGNRLDYPDYWGEAASSQNQAELCMAERFADSAVIDGDQWLDKKAAAMIKECREGAPKDKPAFFTCIQTNLETVMGALSAPCRELAAAELWEEAMCRQLISYIFITKFEPVMSAQAPIWERGMIWAERFNDMRIFRGVFNPLSAMLFLFVYVIDFVFFIDHGNWARASRPGFLAGMAILGSWFAPGGFKYLVACGVIIILALKMALNHHRYNQLRQRKFGKLL